MLHDVEFRDTSSSGTGQIEDDDEEDDDDIVPLTKWLINDDSVIFDIYLIYRFYVNHIIFYLLI